MSILERGVKMNIVALLTGRGNNTLKDKNILPVLGRPLLHYIAMAAKKSNLINAFYASSDCDRILEAAKSIGYKAIKRPIELGLPTTQHQEVVEHAFNIIQSEIGSVDIMVVLLANVATVKTEWIDSCIRILLDDTTVSAAVPVHEDSDHHPYRAKRCTAQGFLEPFFDFSGRKISTNRQDLDPSYFLDHSFWVLNIKESLLSGSGQPPWNFMGNRIKPYETHGSFDVHSIEDIHSTEKWLRENGCTAD
jgi:CMP-N-acetylneuraminic acid synthetase